MPSVSDLMVRSLINADPEYFMFGEVFCVLFCDPEVSVNVNVTGLPEITWLKKLDRVKPVESFSLSTSASTVMLNVLGLGVCCLPF